MIDLFDKWFDLTTTHEVFEVIGEDRERFLQGQLTNNVNELDVGDFQLQARLDRAGRLKSYFYLLKEVERLLIVIDKDLSEGFYEDLNKFIIMDDVEIKTVSESIKISWPQEESQNSFRGILANFPGMIHLGETSFGSKNQLSKIEKEQAFLLGAEPVLGQTAKIDTLVTDSILNLSAVSLSKGCFLGQETVAKIETRRGGAFFPVLLKAQEGVPELKRDDQISFDGKVIGKVLNSLTDHRLIVASLIRNHRVIGKKMNITLGDQSLGVEVDYLPFNGEFDKRKFVQSVYERAVNLFQQDKDEDAIELFKKVVLLDPAHEDSYEAIGVILGRLERFEEGITFMDKVLEANPDSVMAHTNKSLFYMRLGKIEEAEEEKAQATVKSFSSFGKEAEQKKALEEKKKQEEAEIARRMEMFQQVLEIDPDDNLANYGMADIYFHKKEFQKAEPLLKKVIETNNKYSVAYLLLGKTYLAMNEIENAKEVLIRGIEKASTQGDLMPANEMQAKLNELS